MAAGAETKETPRPTSKGKPETVASLRTMATRQRLLIWMLTSCEHERRQKTRQLSAQTNKKMAMKKAEIVPIPELGQYICPFREKLYARMAALYRGIQGHIARSKLRFKTTRSP